MIQTFSKVLGFLLLPVVGFLFYSGAKASKAGDGRELVSPSKAIERSELSYISWKDLFEPRTSPLELPDSEFNELAQGMSTIQSLFLQLRRLHAQGNDASAVIAEAKKTLVDSIGNRERGPDDQIFVPYLLEEIYSSLGATDQDRDFSGSLLASLDGKSCPEKEFFLEQISNSDGDSRNLFFYQKNLFKLSQFQSSSFKSEGLDLILGSVLDGAKAEIAKEFQKYLEPRSELASQNSWIYGETSGKNKLSLLDSNLESLKDNTKKRRCQAAKGNLKNASALLNLKEVNDRAILGDALNSVESCYRRLGRSARKQYWRDVGADLSKSVGFRGAAIAKLRLAQLDWGDDLFDLARPAVESILKEAEEKKDSLIAEDALFILARIEENDGRFDIALSYFDQYSQKYPDSTNFLEAKTSSIILDVLIGKKDKALGDSRTLIEQQDKLEADSRGVGELSLALFWAGKLELEAGNQKQALVYLRRLATEYHSTFYGGLGHYLYEQLTKERLVVGISRGPEINFKSELEALSNNDQATLNRMIALAKTGLKDDMMCEAKELEESAGKPFKTLVLAVFNNVADQWLTSIKYYDRLPRSYRARLTGDFEKLLFPKKFEPNVSMYAERLGLDPDFIFSIIRQESVFNPRARSSVGARGLMQLMPATARYEVKRLSPQYLEESERQALKSAAANQNGLLDPNTNIAIGVQHVHHLFQRYQDPIQVLTSYNANPSATAKWLRTLATDDDLIFIERIPYKETKQYVKLVLRNFFYYKLWYGDSMQKIPMLDKIALGKGAADILK